MIAFFLILLPLVIVLEIYFMICLVYRKEGMNME